MAEKYVVTIEVTETFDVVVMASGIEEAEGKALALFEDLDECDYEDLSGTVTSPEVVHVRRGGEDD